jgi:uncharacterized protein (DUF3820 family)
MDKKASKKMDKEIQVPFGKYKGRNINDVLTWDENYCRWLKKQEWLSKFTDLYDVLDKHFQNQTE